LILNTQVYFEKVDITIEALTPSNIFKNLSGKVFEYSCLSTPFTECLLRPSRPNRFVVQSITTSCLWYLGEPTNFYIIYKYNSDKRKTISQAENTDTYTGTPYCSNNSRKIIQHNIWNEIKRKNSFSSHCWLESGVTPSPRKIARRPTYYIYI